jgi:hypothetical protein
VTKVSTNAILEALQDRARDVGWRALGLLEEAATARETLIEAHPLGMIAIRYKCAGFALRIHVWTSRTSDFRDEFAQVHDHTWHLESYVLAGRVQNHVFDLTEDRTGHEIWLHDYTRNEIVKSEHRVTLQTRCDELLNAGDSYVLSAGTVHSTSVAPGSITLVKSIPSGLSFARIIGAQEGSQPRSAVRGSVDLDQVLSDIRAAS